MNKFENVDVLASLQQIMQQNTAAFQNDFDIDKKILTQAARSKNAEDISAIAPLMSSMSCACLNISPPQKRRKSGAFLSDGFKNCARKIAYRVWQSSAVCG